MTTAFDGQVPPWLDDCFVFKTFVHSPHKGSDDSPNSSLKTLPKSC